MTALLAFYEAHPVLALAILGALFSVAAKASAKRFPAFSSALYTLAAIAPADLVRALGGGTVTPAQRLEIERALLERLGSAMAAGVAAGIDPLPPVPAPAPPAPKG